MPDRVKELSDDLIALAASRNGGANAATEARDLINKLHAEVLRRAARDVHVLTQGSAPEGQSERYWNGWDDAVDASADKLRSKAADAEVGRV